MPTAPKTFRANGITPAQSRKQYDRQRGSAAQRGYTPAWNRYSKWYLSQPEVILAGCCCGCGQWREGRMVTDHIEPCEPTDERFMDMRNHQPMRTACNTTKGRGLDVAVRSGRLSMEQRKELERMKQLAAERAEAIERRHGGWV